ncbi:MAG: ABC transporter ATP-binding protein [Bacteroidales bacterium]|nr:ABC transporter ATP-binding protein [Bacteroidales bacterium]
MIEINISGLQKKYGHQLALDIDSLHVEPGQLCGIVGNNGAGKTTMFRLMLDLIEADAGTIHVNQGAVAGNARWKDFTGSYLDEGFLIDFMTPEEYFTFTGGLYGFSEAEIKEALVPYKRFLTDEIVGQRKYIRQLSSGNKQKTGIVAALITRPGLLILDEPFNYLDPSSQILIRRMLQQDNEVRKTTMLISSHNLNHITGMCNRIILLEKGRIIRDLQLPNDSLEEIERYFAMQAE